MNGGILNPLTVYYDQAHVTATNAAGMVRDE